MDGFRFWSKVHIKPGCWDWTASLSTDGYGQFGLNGSSYQAHRIAYQYLVGPIPNKLQLDHLCRNRKCCNPDHLEPVTQYVNTMRGVGVGAINAAKTHCVNGHELSGENLYTWNGVRSCRKCRNIASANYRGRKVK